MKFNIEFKISNLNYLFLIQYFTKRKSFMVSRIRTFMTLFIIVSVNMYLLIYLMRLEEKKYDG